jgi:hypothetical protein
LARCHAARRKLWRSLGRESCRLSVLM